MTTTQLRVQLAIALGLPACGSSTTPPSPPYVPPPERVAPPSEKPPLAESMPVTNNTCPKDFVLEQVCGLTEKYHSIEKVKAPAPHDVCGINPIPLNQFDYSVFIDPSQWGNHDEKLSAFYFDLSHTQSYRYGGTVREGDVWCCYQRCAQLPVVAKARESLPANLFEHEVCVPPPVAGPSVPAATQSACPAAMKLSYVTYNEKERYHDDAPFKRIGERGHCCYAVASPRKCDTSMVEDQYGSCQYPSRGRPWRDDDQMVTAPTIHREDWSAPCSFDDLDETTRRYAAAAWTREAAAEHASIPAFARFSIELVMLGAPAALVDAAHAAARDEIRHATAAYGIASALAGEPIGPGKLAVDATPRITTLVSLVAECLRDGCVEETVASISAADARVLAVHAPIQHALDAVAIEEARHAQLAFETVAWALRSGDVEIPALVAAQITALRSELPTELQMSPGFDARLGMLSPQGAMDSRRRAITEVVIPSLQGLLASVAVA